MGTELNAAIRLRCRLTIHSNLFVYLRLDQGTVCVIFIEIFKAVEGQNRTS